MDLSLVKCIFVSGVKVVDVLARELALFELCNIQAWALPLYLLHLRELQVPELTSCL